MSRVSVVMKLNVGQWSWPWIKLSTSHRWVYLWHRKSIWLMIWYIHGCNKAIRFLTWQASSSVHKLRSASLFHEDSSRSRKDKLLGFAFANILHAIIIFALSASQQMFLLVQCLQERPSHPCSLHSTQSNLLWLEHTFSGEHLFEANT